MNDEPLDPLMYKVYAAQRDEFRERALDARRALIDAKRLLEEGDMAGLRAVLVANTPVKFDGDFVAALLDAAYSAKSEGS